MKKTIAIVMLVTGITGKLLAQQSVTDKNFGVPADVIMNRQFDIDLGKGNKLQLEMSDVADMPVAANIDSLLQTFFTDIAPLKDSFADPLSSKRLDYYVDISGTKKIRFQQSAPAASSFVINKGELSVLKTAQDTIHLIGAIVHPPRGKDFVSNDDRRFYHYTFFLNDINDLNLYFKDNTLNEKLNTLRNNIHDKWKRVPGEGLSQLKKDNSISALKPKGYSAIATKDYLTILGAAGIQNYKNNFVPSFSIGARITLSNAARTFKREFGLFWEPHFLFAKDSAGRSGTYRNDFLTLTYSQGGITDHNPEKAFSFNSSFSFGWLQRNRGGVFDKNTFRLGIGKIDMLKTSVEPCLYFNNFFKGVTPGIRITQFF